ncbi:hypothetical protein HPB51_028269 [Rhipicephalus microplus]|uniref:Uncharacterized protein n=1 Tax=Rhipicephalus microplus TaxID=6941 RepID=A0A9J6CXT0_RHIMP|nr:hypothetical protein HPB51_028269 [Rhipicephalus microplus]
MSANNSNTSVSKEDATEDNVTIASSEQIIDEEDDLVDEYLREVLSLDPEAMEQLSVLDQEGTRAPTNSAISVEARTPELPAASGPTLRCRVDSKTAFAKRRSQPTVAEASQWVCGDSLEKHWLVFFHYGKDVVLVCDADMDHSGALTGRKYWKKRTVVFNGSYSYKESIAGPKYQRALEHRISGSFRIRVRKACRHPGYLKKYTCKQKAPEADNHTLHLWGDTQESRLEDQANFV